MQKIQQLFLELILQCQYKLFLKQLLFVCNSALGCLCLTLILLLVCILFRKLLLQLGQNLIMNTVFLFAVVLTYVKCLKQWVVTPSMGEKATMTYAVGCSVVWLRGFVCVCFLNVFISLPAKQCLPSHYAMRYYFQHIAQPKDKTEDSVLCHLEGSVQLQRVSV